ncbi:hypothetical protein HPB50_002716 [Hyalomma asiaticum]|uniref:Uncharacterized protein n=1 Tax=Hyalomma asiaticum TaxID=266040 RepID=A0ACB7TDX5_HYAAI|nr:hypothetical protein HPB50_002716 [Hyalomma asiaticum]
MCRWRLVIWMGAMLSSLAEAGPKRSAWAMVTPGSSKLVIQDGEPIFTVSSKGVPEGAVAWATFQDDVYENGWSYLQIESNPYVDDEQQAYAAGALEAYLTRELMENQWVNLFSPYCVNQDDYCGRVNDFLTRNLAHTREQQHKFKGSDAFWNVV